MASKLKGSFTKRALIDQANSKVVILTSVAAFILVFCAVSSKTLAGQLAYQNRVISSKRVAVNQLHSDIGAVSTLKNSYDAFTSTQQNIIGGNPNGNGPQDGDNAKLVLDALPSTYDFPALATSIDKLLSSEGVTVSSISGTDDQLTQGAVTSSSTPTDVPIPFQASVSGSYANIQNLMLAFDKSIRPIQIQTLSLSGSQANVSLTLTAQTFYQPSKSLNITTKVVK